MLSISNIKQTPHINSKNKISSSQLLLNQCSPKETSRNFTGIFKLTFNKLFNFFKIEKYTEGMKGSTSFYRPNQQKPLIAKIGSIEYYFSLWLENRGNKVGWYHKDY